ncbi:MAG: hypothetical protein IPL99_25720 [Candidatus Competibacteraceae bacterium]|nr:hypothetical protein [Candidatus Competibacteraceae bacterium]
MASATLNTVDVPVVDPRWAVAPFGPLIRLPVRSLSVPASPTPSCCTAMARDQLGV